MNANALLIFIAGTILPSALVAWLAGYAVRQLAPKFGLVDKPGLRKVHTTPTPLGGGVAIWLGLLAPFAAGQLMLTLVASGVIDAGLLPEFARAHLSGLSQQAPRLWVLLGAGTVLMLLGLADDRYGLDWRIRLSVQLAVATFCVVTQGWQLTVFIQLHILTVALSVLWIGALVNSFNMLDNMDGLSGGVGVIASSILAAVLILAPDPETRGPQLFVAGLLLVLVGAIVGFLFHNRPPAKIFMGDAGSYLIGFVIAVATLLATYTSYEAGRRHAVLAPLFVLAVPLYDMTTVIWIRLREGRSPFQADKCHFSHRLVDLGMSKTQAVLTIYLTSATCGLGALLLHRVDGIGAAVISVMVACVLALIAILESTARRALKSRQ
ncbi:MAG TPA: MraY family glycosyltransferase [Pirellulaceae bacterium]|nr:MraY family glycosyltransferase [Pirellulaceae bacterium]